MYFLEPAPSVSSSLSERLKRATNRFLSGVIKANYDTQFAQAASGLSEFRHAITGRVDRIDDDDLSKLFRETVHFTTYDAYAPFLAGFSEKPCKANAIVDLFAPGLPDVLVVSSSTSGGLAKIFPKYNRWSGIRSDATSWIISDPLRRRTTAHIFNLECNPINVEDEDNGHVTTIYSTSGSVVSQRMHFGLDPRRDGEKMTTFILDHAAPYAAGFITKWSSFLLIQALFSMGTRSLETMSMVFINTFVDMMRHLDKEFDLIVECIANGTIPDLDGIADVRRYLEMNISPDPERAAELHSLGRPSSRRGWCGHVWPQLRSISCISSGYFTSSISLAQWFLGSHTTILPYVYASSEAVIAVPYNPRELNQFKITNEIVVEFLDVNKSNSISSLVQLWEVEKGGRYEVVLTTKDGLWRYQLGDVIEICGFDPSDGVPIISFVQRRNATIRFPDFMVTETDLRAAISSTGPNFATMVVDWTTAIDDRNTPPTIGFFVELADDTLSDWTLVPRRVLDELTRSNENIAWALDHDAFGKPTIRLVRAGTFSEFRQLKLDEGSSGLGQVKVPVVLPKAAYVTWFGSRVVKEL